MIHYNKKPSVRYKYPKMPNQCLKIVIYYLLLTLLSKSTLGQEAAPAEGDDKKKNNSLPYWREGYDGHGTTHEQIGQPHFTSPEYTDYISTVRYTEEPPYSSGILKPVYNVSHFFYDNLFSSEPIPEGYIVVRDENTLILGPKVEENDWSDLLSHYWLFWLWVLIWVILIFLIPFIAVFYCCFCCCRRCKPGCPPCDRNKNATLRCCYGLLLLLLIILLLIGIIIALLANRLLDRGFQETSNVMKRGSEDTCKFLKDVSDHIYHLFVYNYQELQTHLIQELHDAHKHLFLDLADTSESGAIEELLRILSNMPQALKLMLEVDKIEKDIRFYGAQLRDGVRGAKRDLVYAAVLLCTLKHCPDILRSNNLLVLDMSICLHYDTVPNTTVFVEGIRDIIKENYVEIPKLALARLKKIRDKIKDRVAVVIPPLIRDLISGADAFRRHATNIRSIIDSVISDIHMNTLHSTKSFEDAYDKFGYNREIINIIACILLIMVFIILVIALVFGCCGVTPTGYKDPFCNKGIGASCLLLAIILIFMIFSIVALLGLFYFVYGFITYHGACAPLRDRAGNSGFRQIDAFVNLNKYLPQSDDGDGEMDDRSLQKMSVSNAITACQENQTIFELLKANNLYDVEEIRNIKVLTPVDDTAKPTFQDDVFDVLILTEKEQIRLNDMRNGNLSSYHSSLFLENMCTPFTPSPLPTVASGIKTFANSIFYHPYVHRYAYISFWNEAKHLEVYHNTFVTELERLQPRMKDKLLLIDQLILYENHNFSDSIGILLDSIIRSEKFIKERGKDFLNSLSHNLTQYLQVAVDDYKNRLIYELNNNVGHCKPLAYIYNRGVDLVCYRLVDPMNALWVGLLLCSLVLLPILFLAHKLMCIYKQYDFYVAPVLVEGGCPICTGAPYVPPPIITCSGAQQTLCECQSDNDKSRKSGKSGKSSRGGGGSEVVQAEKGNKENEGDQNTEDVHGIERCEIGSHPGDSSARRSNEVSSPTSTKNDELRIENSKTEPELKCNSHKRKQD